MTKWGDVSIQPNMPQNTEVGKIKKSFEKLLQKHFESRFGKHRDDYGRIEEDWSSIEDTIHEFCSSKEVEAYLQPNDTEKVLEDFVGWANTHAG